MYTVERLIMIIPGARDLRSRRNLTPQEILLERRELSSLVFRFGYANKYYMNYEQDMNYELK